MAVIQPDDLVSAVAGARERAVASVARLRHAEADFVTVRETASINSDAYTWADHAAAALKGAASSMEQAARTLSDCAEKGAIHLEVARDLAIDMIRLRESMMEQFRTIRSAAPQDSSESVMWMDEAMNALSDDLDESVMDSHFAVVRIVSFVGGDLAWDLLEARHDTDYSAAELKAIASTGMLGVMLKPALRDNADNLTTDASTTGTES